MGRTNWKTEWRVRLVDETVFRRTHKDLINLWRSMLNRCYRETYNHYEDYGGRGITVCDRWHTFENFLNDMPPRPSGHSLERIDNDGNYCPENCRWATQAEQMRNTRKTKRITANGETKHLAVWARELNSTPSAILYRLENGWTEQDAVTIPIPKRPNSRLSDDQVREVLRLYPANSLNELAGMFNVSQKTIFNIVNGKIFKDIAVEQNYVRGPIPKRERKKIGFKFLTFNGETLSYVEWERKLGLTRGIVESRIRKGCSVEQALSTERVKRRREGACKLTDDQVRSIKAEHAQGISGYALSKKYGVDKSVIYQIIKGETYTHVV